MALLMLEGFDHYQMGGAGGGHLAMKGWIGQPFGEVKGRVPYGPQSQAAAVIEFNPIHKALPSTASDLVVGFAFQIGYLHGIHLCTLHDQTLEHAAAVGVSSDGFLTVTDAHATFTGTHALKSGTWYYVELKLDSGVAEVHLNGTIVDILGAAGDFSHDWYLVTIETGGVFSPPVLFDDFYLLDLTGPTNNDFLGDIVVETLYPVSDGTYRDWTPDTGTDHYPRVNEIHIDELASYVETAGAGDKDTYNVGDPALPDDTTVFGVQLNLGVLKRDSGVRTINPLIRQAGTDYTGPTTYAAADWAFVSWLLNQDPSGEDWTAANVMGDEYGIELTT